MKKWVGGWGGGYFVTEINIVQVMGEVGGGGVFCN